MSLNYKKSGKGTPLIILHGLFGSLDNWQTLARKFSEHFTVYLLDLPNHGRSPHFEKHNYELLSEELLKFLDEQKIEKAHFIGHSMGGKAVMKFSLLHPERVLKQIIVDIAPKKYPRGHDEIFDAFFSLNLSAIEKREDADTLMAEKISHAAIRQFLLKNLERNADSENYEWKMNLEVLHRDYDEISAAIQSKTSVDIPTLVIRGSRSDYVSDEDLKIFRQMFPKTTMTDIENAGHWVHAEAPGELLTIVNRFLLD